MTKPTTCSRCSTGLAGIKHGCQLTPGGDMNYFCPPCCGDIEKEFMIENGRTTLYLVSDEGDWVVQDFLGVTKFKTAPPRVGRHNLAHNRYDVWFNGPDGFLWHAVRYGDNTEICHCKRTKEHA